MGIFWSTSPLHESLLNTCSVEPCVIRPGDILLASDSLCDESIFGGGECWVDVAIIVRKDDSILAYNGQFSELNEYVAQYKRVSTRPLHCVRYSHFDKAILEAANKTQVLAERAGVVNAKNRSSFVVARVMYILELVDTDALHQKWSPAHFSSSHWRTSLTFYGPNKEL